eukprot:GGOE01001289.1.p1 GENE.GGOE01001289.1~~GGOE01001289.1.p1  ORF type:complete len:413 (+),score=121.93 GGOE01001289.1:57-1295(+)
MATVPCPFVVYGCPEKRLPTNSLEAHLTGAAAQHLNFVCVELVHHRTTLRTQQRAQEQQWAKELADAQASATAREAELKQQLSDLQASVEAQSTTIERLLRGSIIVVDQAGCGLFTSIAAALKACREGDTIVVRGGEYTEQLVMAVPGITVRGTDNPDTVVRSGEEAPALTFLHTAEVTGLTIVQDHPGHPCIRFVAGEGVLHQCDITGLEMACIQVDSNANPKVQHCRIHSSRQAGITFLRGSRGLVEHCRVFATDGANVEVKSGAIVTMRHSKLFDSRLCGLVLEDTGGEFLQNEMYNSAVDNVQIRGGDPKLTKNRIYSAQQYGISITRNARPQLTDNDISSNNVANVMLAAGVEPLLIQNTIHNSRQFGILVLAGAGGELRDNDVHNNIARNIKLEDGAKTKVVGKAK